MLNDELESVNQAIRMVCEASVGVLDKDFLCRTLSVLDPHEPICVREQDSLEYALDHLRAHRVGCVLVLGADGKLSGVFSERDFVVKVARDFEQLRAQPICNFMSREPTVETMDCTIAFALNLMSHGGLRHLPIVDGEGRPVGLISVKDVVDFIVETLTNDLLNFSTTPEVSA